jgi:hypothetical protein
MRCVLIFATCLFWVLGKAAMAQPIPVAPDFKNPENAPLTYPRTYSDEIARRFGTEQGSLRLFDTSPNISGKDRSRLSGQLGTKGIRFKLQW